MGGAGKGRSWREKVGVAMQGRLEGCCGDDAVLYLTVSTSICWLRYCTIVLQDGTIA